MFVWRQRRKGAIMAGAKNVVSTVTEGILPVVEELGYVLWDVEFVKVGGKHTLIVTIDNDEGITIEDCERVHRAIDPVLDELDPIEQAYDLSVSSPGIERDIRTNAHIDACVGECIEVRFFAPYEGQKAIKGTLEGREEDKTLLLSVNGEQKAIPRSAIAKMQTVFEF